MVANSRSGREDVKAVVNNGMNGGEFLEDMQSRKTADDSCVFSESILWKIQRDFYETHGIQCWQQGIIPNFASSNCYIGHAYAYAILGFLRDYWKGKEPSDPVYIVEAGAGSAQLSYVLIKHLISWRKFWPYEGCFKYIVTEFSAANFEFWMNHSSLQHLTEVGLLDFSVFDPENTEVLKLELSGLELTLTQHPIILVANYVFDSLKQDAFQVVNGDLYEMLCTTTVPSNLDSTSVDFINYIKWSWNVKKKDVGDLVKSYYPDKPHWNEVLLMLENTKAPKKSLSDAGLVNNAPASRREEGSRRDVKDKEKDVVVDNKKQDSLFLNSEEGQKIQNEVNEAALSFLLPIGVFCLLDKLRSLSSGGRLVVLAGDKGITSPIHMIGCREPHIALHGSFSCMVNFMALCDYCQVEGGWAKLSPSLEGFKCCVMMLGMGDEDECCKPYPRFRKALDNILGIFGPGGFFTLQRLMHDETHSLSLKGALNILRLSHHDTDVFYKFKGVIIEQCPFASSKLQADILYDMEKTCEFNFPLQPYKDIAFEIGRVLMGLEVFARAAELFRDSQRHFGVHHVSYFNMGVCHREIGNLELADECFSQSQALCPDYPDVLKARRDMELQKQSENGKNKGP